MEISSAQREGCTVVTVKGRLDAETAPAFENSCNGLIGEGKARFVIDMAELAYISSAGLRAILAIAKRLKQSGSDLVVARLTPMVSEVFTIAGFDRLLKVAPTLEAAVQAS